MSSNDNSVEKILSKINYKLGKKIGEGMFSTVKLGIHSLTNEKVAIKILEKTKITKIEDKERINREIAILKKINHYNIAKLYQVVETKYIIYLIQEYIEGKELLEYLNKKGKLKEIEACKFFHQIISGLDYLHKCGIAHRDFKPENILLTNNNEILKIIDFGLSNSYKKGQLLKTGCGSPCYVPPEMIKEENYNGALSDIWSAGIILYLMLCGKLPFYDDDNQILYEKILSGKFEIPDYLSDNAKDILSNILEIDPKKRINFDGIKNHPWFSIIDKNFLIHKGININEDIIPIDEDIIIKMEKMGLNNKIEIRYNIIKNYYNKITSLYNLLLKQKIDNLQKSIADMKSELFDEYINDKKNKINFYGNLENALKNRIGDDQKIINNIPNYPENKYDDNNENIIIGDSGSMMERLIKAGKFIYDEENMCLTRVVNNKITKLKETNNDPDSKFKTISTIQENKSDKNKFKKMTEMGNIIYSPDVNKTKKNKVHFKEDLNDINLFKSPNPNKPKIKNFNKNENNEKKEEDEDWYKEMEEMIDLEIENKKKSEKSEKNKKSEKTLRESKTSDLHKNKKNKTKNKNQSNQIDNEEIDIDKNKKNKYPLSSQNSKGKIINPSEKKPKSKFINNNDNKINNKYKSTKNININNKKEINNTEVFSDKKKLNHKTAKVIKTIKLVKNLNENKSKNGKRKENSAGKNEKEKKTNKFKKINVDKDQPNVGEEQRRNQSAQKRKIKIKI